MNTAFTVTCLVASAMAATTQLQAAHEALGSESLTTLAQKPTFASY